MRTSPRPLTTFESYWLAEIVRQHESSGEALSDQALLPELQAASPDTESRILLRADRLGQREGWRNALLDWRDHARTTLLIFALIALFSGFASAMALMSSTERPVNVIWVLGGLLGVHLFSLMLWLAGLFTDRDNGERGASALLGRAWCWMSERLGGRANRKASIGTSFMLLLARHHLMRWLTGSISHLLWILALLGALTGLWIALATQRYSFVWETTILPADVFVGLTAALSSLPALLGFNVPDADMVRASGEAVLQDEATRQAWSSWLLGCLIAYGLLPRLLLFSICHVAWLRGKSRMRLDFSLPGYAQLRARLSPASAPIGIVDHDPKTLQRRHLTRHAPRGDSHTLMVGLELGSDLGWPPETPWETMAWPVVESRDERHRLLEHLDQQPPGRLLVAIDARLSPDRGTLGYLTELADRADDMHVWLRGIEQSDRQRVLIWREALLELGLPHLAIEEQPQHALNWLERGHD